jgi:hypothetical protein
MIHYKHQLYMKMKSKIAVQKWVNAATHRPHLDLDVSSEIFSDIV